MKQLSNNKKLKILDNMLQFLQKASITTERNTPLKEIKFFIDEMHRVINL